MKKCFYYILVFTVLFGMSIVSDNCRKNDEIVESNDIVESMENIEVDSAIDEECDMNLTIDENTFIEEDYKEDNSLEKEFQIIEEEKIEPIVFSSDITFACEYVLSEEYMPYALYTPSSANPNEPSNLIVWLHGSGEVGAWYEDFLSRGINKVINDWTLEGFNAYVLCPQLYSKWNTNQWNTETCANNLQVLLDLIIEKYNINTNNIIIGGHSLGGYGAEYMAWKFPQYFSKAVVMSGYDAGIPHNEILIPVIGYVGATAAGEHNGSERYMLNAFAYDFGAENVHHLIASHGGLPSVAFNEDLDGNNRSDLIEWMFANVD